MLVSAHTACQASLTSLETLIWESLTALNNQHTLPLISSFQLLRDLSMTVACHKQYLPLEPLGDTAKFRPFASTDSITPLSGLEIEVTSIRNTANVISFFCLRRSFSNLFCYLTHVSLFYHLHSSSYHMFNTTRILCHQSISHLQM